MENNTRDLLVRGIAAAKAKETNEARFFLNWVLRLEPPHDDQIEALYWLSELSQDPAEQKKYMEEILINDPGEPRARRKLAILEGRLNPKDIIDPDQLISPVPAPPQAASADRFICPGCGGRMAYTPDGQSLTCDYCETRQKLHLPGSIAGDDFAVAMATGLGHLHPVAMHAFTCQGCGAAFILPPERLTLTCPYCESVHVIKQLETRLLAAPDGIIPFQVSELSARRAMKSWLEQHPVQPPLHVAPGRGIYLPVWSFRLTGQIPWTALESDGDRWLPVSGLKLVERSDCLVPAARRLPEMFTTSLQDYNLKELVPYEEKYLADWLAETYQVPIGEASLKAREAVLAEQRQQINDGLLRPVKDLNLKTADMNVDSFKLLLLPAWLTHYQSAGETYPVFINGQTGKVTSERPAMGMLGWLKKITGF
jgi:DNA-directed RNA polymerase subunit RPC12/RpoP